VPRAGGVLASIDRDGFVIEPLSERSACTPRSVAAHMLYENADPQLLHEPGGTLDTSTATNMAIDDRRVRVEGSRWIPAAHYTVKLEGAALVGYQTMIVSGIRDPRVLAQLDTWCDQVLAILHEQIQGLFELAPESYDLQIRRYGHDAVLGHLDPRRGQPPKEVGVVLLATAPDQQTATEMAKVANPLLLHAPLTMAEPFPSFALLGSPAEVPRGPVHEFVLQHVVEVDDPSELCRTHFDEVGP
jgi:hypothetical protein